MKKNLIFEIFDFLLLYYCFILEENTHFNRIKSIFQEAQIYCVYMQCELSTAVFFRAFAPIFHFKLQFLLVRAQKYFFPRAQGALATPLIHSLFFWSEAAEYSLSIVTYLYCKTGCGKRLVSSELSSIYGLCLVQKFCCGKSKHMLSTPYFKLSFSSSGFANGWR